MRRICRRPAASLPLLLCACGLAPAMLSSVGCKSLSESYIRLEVWKYERCFGHLPPGFVPPGVAGPVAAPAMQPCGQPAMGAAPCGAAPCGPAAGGAVVAGSGGCDGCSGSVVEGMPSGAIPAAGTTMPTPSPTAAVTTSKPVIISDEVVLP